MKARIYMRVSTEGQDLKRQEILVEKVRKVKGLEYEVYSEKASGTTMNRPELLRLLADIEEGDVVVCERIDRLSRLDVESAEKLIEKIRSKGARLAIEGVCDFSEVIAATQDKMSRIVLETMQSLLLKISLQVAREDYEVLRERQAQGILRAKAEGKFTGRPRDKSKRNKIKKLLNKGTDFSINEIANLVGCSRGLVYEVKKEAG